MVIPELSEDSGSSLKEERVRVVICIKRDLQYLKQ